MLKSIIKRSKREKHITFVYTGNNGEDIPINVTHVRVLYGVTKIDAIGCFVPDLDWKVSHFRLTTIYFSATLI